MEDEREPDDLSMKVGELREDHLDIILYLLEWRREACQSSSQRPGGRQ